MRTILFLLLAIPVFGQSIDSTQTFSLETYLTWVRAFHPVMLEAALWQKKSEAQLLKAKGNFDPKGFGAYEDKSFDQKNYFRVGEAGLKIPTWWGADVKVAYLWSNGAFLNNAATLPQNGQAVFGIDLPLIQGIVIDERRTQVEQARLLRGVNEMEQRAVVNDFLLEAIESYWDWANKYQLVQIYGTSLELAEDRFRVIKESFLQGDKPAIDTLESLIQLQNRQLQLNQAAVELQNAVLQISNFLWYENTTPLEVSPQLQPEELSQNLLVNVEDVAIATIQETHPDLLMLALKQQQLKVKEKLKREQFKPQLRVNYNFLGNGLNLLPENPDASTVQNLFVENYKWGLNFDYPLFLRKARGDMQLLRIEQLETTYKMQNKTLQISNKINSMLQLLRTNYEQMNTQRAVIANYEKLLDAENEKFRIGESSIFLLNNREQKLIDAQIKLIKLQINLHKLRWKLEWTQGEIR